MKRPTIAEVARRAGVSTGTVSRYLNGGHRVSPASSESVRRAIEETGYVANTTARQLRTGRSGTVAFLIDERPAKFFDDPNFETLVAGVSDALSAVDMSMVMLLAGDAENVRRVEKFLRTSGVDGAVTISVHPRHHLLERVLDTRVPLVNCGFPRSLETRVSYVAADEAQGATLMAHHLLEQGATHVGVIAGPEDSPGGSLRRDAFQTIIDESGQAEIVTVLHGDYTRSSGRRLGTEALTACPHIDAIFAGSDAMAAGVLDAARDLGRPVPDSLIVGGFDDSAFATGADLPLTTIHQPFDQISTELVSVLQREISDGYRSAVTVPVKLVERLSTRRPATH